MSLRTKYSGKQKILAEMKLFWATTIDGYENWFVVAETEEKAAQFHEFSEGFNSGDAKAKYVCNIPKNLIERYEINEANWPSHQLLNELGGKIITEDNPRKVNFGGKIYTEGTFSEMMFIKDIDNVAGVYIIKNQNTKKYKIGITKNLKKRIKQFSTGNPENIKIVYFIKTKHYKSLEVHLHEIFKNYRIGGEWFNFSDEKLSEIENNFELLQHRAPSDFKVYNIKNVSIQGRVY